MSAKTSTAPGSSFACSLNNVDLERRLSRIAALATRWLLRREKSDRVVRLWYAREAAEELQCLVEQEKQCCAFLQFELQRQPDGMYLEITAPQQAQDSVERLYLLFGPEDAAQQSSCAPACAGQHAGFAQSHSTLALPFASLPLLEQAPPDDAA